MLPTIASRADVRRTTRIVAIVAICPYAWADARTCERGQEACNPERYILPQLVELNAMQASPLDSEGVLWLS